MTIPQRKAFQEKERGTAVKSTAAAATALSFLISTLLAPLAQASLWEERRRAARSASESVDAVASPLGQYAQLPDPSADLSHLLPAVTVEKSLSWSPLSNFPPDQEVAGDPDRTQVGRLPRWITSLPGIYGDIQKVRLAPQPETRPLVVMVQDAHDVTSAQLNIAQILQHLHVGSSLEGRPLLVGLEGSRGGFRLDAFRAFPDKARHNAVSEYLLRKGFISGPEYFGLVSEKEPALWGVETADLYLANVNAYRRSVPIKEAFAKRVAALKTALLPAQEEAFTPELAALEKTLDAYHKGELSLMDFVNHLTSKQGANLDRFPHVRSLLQALSMEKALDFKQVERERDELIRVLTKTLSKTALDDLLQRSLAYRTGRLSYGQYYASLRSLVRSRGIRLESYKAFEPYIRYVLLSEKLEPAALFDEVEGLKDAVVALLAKTAPQKELMALGEDLRLVEKLSQHELGPREWSVYAARKEKVAALESRVAALISAKAGAQSEHPSSLAAFLPAFEAFYAAADARNAALVENLVRKMDARAVDARSQAPPAAVLVAGGFHTPGLQALLEARKISYATLTPKMELADGKASAYLDLFTANRTPIQKLMLGERLFVNVEGSLAQKSMAPETLGKRAGATAGAYEALYKALAAMENGDTHATLLDALFRAAGVRTVQQAREAVAGVQETLGALVTVQDVTTLYGGMVLVRLTLGENKQPVTYVFMKDASEKGFKDRLDHLLRGANGVFSLSRTGVYERSDVMLASGGENVTCRFAILAETSAAPESVQKLAAGAAPAMRDVAIPLTHAPIGFALFRDTRVIAQAGDGNVEPMTEHLSMIAKLPFRGGIGGLQELSGTVGRAAGSAARSTGPRASPRMSASGQDGSDDEFDEDRPGEEAATLSLEGKVNAIVNWFFSKRYESLTSAELERFLSDSDWDSNFKAEFEFYGLTSSPGEHRNKVREGILEIIHRLEVIEKDIVDNGIKGAANDDEDVEPSRLIKKILRAFKGETVDGQEVTVALKDGAVSVGIPRGTKPRDVLAAIHKSEGKIVNYKLKGIIHDEIQREANLIYSVPPGGGARHAGDVRSVLLGLIADFPGVLTMLPEGVAADLAERNHPIASAVRKALESPAEQTSPARPRPYMRVRAELAHLMTTLAETNWEPTAPLSVNTEYTIIRVIAIVQHWMASPPTPDQRKLIVSAARAAGLAVEVNEDEGRLFLPLKASDGTVENVEVEVSGGLSGGLNTFSKSLEARWGFSGGSVGATWLPLRDVHLRRGDSGHVRVATLPSDVLAGDPEELRNALREEAREILNADIDQVMSAHEAEAEMKREEGLPRKTDDDAPPTTPSSPPPAALVADEKDLKALLAREGFGDAVAELSAQAAEEMARRVDEEAENKKYPGGTWSLSSLPRRIGSALKSGAVKNVMFVYEDVTLDVDGPEIVKEKGEMRQDVLRDSLPTGIYDIFIFHEQGPGNADEVMLTIQEQDAGEVASITLIKNAAAVSIAVRDAAGRASQYARDGVAWKATGPLPTRIPRARALEDAHKPPSSEIVAIAVNGSFSKKKSAAVAVSEGKAADVPGEEAPPPGPRAAPAENSATGTMVSGAPTRISEPPSPPGKSRSAEEELKAIAREFFSAAYLGMPESTFAQSLTTLHLGRDHGASADFFTGQFESRRLNWGNKIQRDFLAETIRSLAASLKGVERRILDELLTSGGLAALGAAIQAHSGRAFGMWMILGAETRVKLVNNTVSFQHGTESGSREILSVLHNSELIPPGFKESVRFRISQEVNRLLAEKALVGGAHAADSLEEFIGLFFFLLSEVPGAAQLIPSDVLEELHDTKALGLIARAVKATLNNPALIKDGIAPSPTLGRLLIEIADMMETGFMTRALENTVMRAMMIVNKMRIEKEPNVPKDDLRAVLGSVRLPDGHHVEWSGDGDGEVRIILSGGKEIPVKIDLLRALPEGPLRSKDGKTYVHALWKWEKAGKPPLIQLESGLTPLERLLALTEELSEIASVAHVLERHPDLQIQKKKLQLLVEDAHGRFHADPPVGVEFDKHVVENLPALVPAISGSLLGWVRTKAADGKRERALESLDKNASLLALMALQQGVRGLTRRAPATKEFMDILRETALTSIVGEQRAQDFLQLDFLLDDLRERVARILQTSSAEEATSLYVRNLPDILVTLGVISARTGETFVPFSERIHAELSALGGMLSIKSAGDQELSRVIRAGFSSKPWGGFENSAQPMAHYTSLPEEALEFVDPEDFKPMADILLRPVEEGTPLRERSRVFIVTDMAPGALKKRLAALAGEAASSSLKDVLADDNWGRITFLKMDALEKSGIAVRRKGGGASRVQLAALRRNQIEAGDITERHGVSMSGTLNALVRFWTLGDLKGLERSVVVDIALRVAKGVGLQRAVVADLEEAVEAVDALQAHA